MYPPRATLWWWTTRLIMCADFGRWFLNVLVWANESVCVWRRSRRSRDTSHFSTTSPKNGKVHSVVCFGVGLFSGVMVWNVRLYYYYGFLFVMAVPLCSEICSQFELGGYVQNWIWVINGSILTSWTKLEFSLWAHTLLLFMYGWLDRSKRLL